EPGRALGGLRVACGQGAIEILEAQREGRRAMGAEELARGFALPDILG
ncbi:MAG: methionyl-tRNA formyltransferase, partial [Alphaproteobacteria bacterium]|nr:methionyl-tRNA formyltransferase [Alphaproteobacteria bacterium]